MNFFLNIIAVFLCLSLSVDAQDEFPYTGIVEHFTNTNCSACASHNPGFYKKLDQRSDYVHISYHTRIPYKQCKLYQANKEGNNIRLSVYDNIPGTPYVILNGTYQASAGSITQSNFDNKKSMTSVKIEYSYSGGAIDIKITNNEFENAARDMRLFVATVENPLNYQGPNGEKIHYDVFRNWLTPLEGQKLSSKVTQINFPLSMDNVSVSSNAHIVVFVQDMNSKEIFNAVKSQITTSISTTSLKAEIYPTHVEDEIFIYTPEVNAVEVSISDINGRVVQSSQLTGSQHVIRVDELQVGTYILTLLNKNENKKMSQKIVVK